MTQDRFAAQLVVTPGSQLDLTIRGLGKLAYGLGGIFTPEGEVQAIVLWVQPIDAGTRYVFTPRGSLMGSQTVIDGRGTAVFLNPEDSGVLMGLISPVLVEFDHDAAFDRIVGA